MCDDNQRSSFIDHQSSHINLVSDVYQNLKRNIVTWQLATIIPKCSIQQSFYYWYNN